MATTLDFTPQQAFQNGVFAPGAKVYFYETGTTTPVTVFSDSDYTTPHASPMLADAGGVFSQVFYNGSLEIKAVITAADDTTIATIDPVAKLTTSSSGAAAVSFSPITGNSATNVQDAVANNTNARENRSPAIKTFLTSTDNTEARENLDLGSLATADVLDEDNMATNSATLPPSQQSVKAYVDAQDAAQDTARALVSVGGVTVTDGTSGGFTVAAESGGTTARTGTGTYTFTFTTPQGDANYIVSGVCTDSNRQIQIVTKTTTVLTIETEVSGGGGANDAAFDLLIFAVN